MDCKPTCDNHDAAAMESLLMDFRRAAISAFLKERCKRFAKDQWASSFPSWDHGEVSWRTRSDIGMEDSQLALMWYQHVHKPGSKEWRPSVIVAALDRAIEEDKWRKR